MEYPNPNVNIKELNSNVFAEISELLRPQWREFAACMEGHTQFALSQKEIEKMAYGVHHAANFNCAEKLLDKLSDRGFRVKHLIRYLRQLHLYTALAKLVPSEPLVILSTSDDITQPEGEKLELRCQAASIPPPCYTWYKGNNICRQKSRNSVLSIVNANPEDSGKYICAVTREGEDHVTWSEWIEVEITPQKLKPVHHDRPYSEGACRAPELQPPMAPFIVRQTGGAAGQKTTLSYDNQLVLECLAQGNPTPDYVWLKDDQLINDQKGQTLEIPHVRHCDSGVYQCRVRNSQGEARGYPVEICVIEGKYDKLDIVTHPSNQEIERGCDAVFTVQAEGINLKYQWYKDGEPIQGATESMYKICNVSEKHSGSYKCWLSVYEDNDGQKLKDKFSMDGVLKVNVCTDKPETASVKVALVIGVSPEMGSNERLMCVINDCILITKQLKEMDYKVFSFYNLTKEEIDVAVEMFVGVLEKDAYAVVYLAGHGLINNGQHYFAPVDPLEGVPIKDHLCVEFLQQKLLEKEPKLLCLFLDMCRTQFDGADKHAQAMPLVDTKENGNLVVIYATLPYRQALEPRLDCTDMKELQMPLKLPDKLGILCKHLSNSLTRNIYIDKLFRDVQDSLVQSEDWKQMNKYHKEKPAIPAMAFNLLHWRKKLTDPAIGRNPKLEEKMKKLSSVPDDLAYRIPDLPVEFTVSYKELLSTVVQVTVKPRFIDGNPFLYPIEIRLRLPENDAHKVLMVETEKLPCGPKLCGTTAIISRLHRLETPLSFVIVCILNGDERPYDCYGGKILMSCQSHNFVRKDLNGHPGVPSMSSLAVGEGHKPYGQEHEESFDTSSSI